MTTTLNHKFDLLRSSETCPRYLVDVLGLLVAHANDTEVLKATIRNSSPNFGGYPAIAAPQKNAELLAPPPPLTVAAAENRNGSTVAQQQDEFAVALADQKDVAIDSAKRQLQLAAEKSSAGFMIIAEDTLHTYATDLKKMNDIALATSAKQLREMKTATQSAVAEFRDRTIEDTVQQTASELDSLRFQWLEDLNRTIEHAKSEIHAMEMEACESIHSLTEQYKSFVRCGMQLCATQPLLDVHEALAQAAQCESRLSMLESAVLPPPNAALLALNERVKALEKVVSHQSQLPTPAKVPRPLEEPPREPVQVQVAPIIAPASDADKHAPQGAAPASSKSMPIGLPAQTSSVGTTPKASPATPPLAAAPAAGGTRPPPKSLGVELKDGDSDLGGVLISKVDADSQADRHGFSAGDVIIQVGSTNVVTRAEFAEALRRHTVNGHVSLRIYKQSAASFTTASFER